MNQDNVIRKAEATARKLRREWDKGNADPLYREAHKAIMALLGLLKAETGPC